LYYVQRKKAVLFSAIFRNGVCIGAPSGLGAERVHAKSRRHHRKRTVIGFFIFGCLSAMQGQIKMRGMQFQPTANRLINRPPPYAEGIFIFFFEGFFGIFKSLPLNTKLIQYG